MCVCVCVCVRARMLAMRTLVLCIFCLPIAGSQSSYLDDTPAEGSTESTTSSDDVSQTSEIDDWDFDALMSRPKRKKTESGEDHASTSAALAAAGIASSVSWQFENVLRDSVQRKTNGSSASSTGSMSLRHAYSRKSLPVGADGNPDVLGMKQELEDDLEELGPRLPFNTLDELIQQLGGSSVVAEVCVACILLLLLLPPLSVFCLLSRLV